MRCVESTGDDEKTVCGFTVVSVLSKDQTSDDPFDDVLPHAVAFNTGEANWPIYAPIGSLLTVNATFWVCGWGLADIDVAEFDNAAEAPVPEVRVQQHLRLTFVPAAFNSAPRSAMSLVMSRSPSWASKAR